MTAAWVAASVRARQLAARSAGEAVARSIAGADRWEDAREVLARTMYGERLVGEADPAGARQSAYEATAWLLRVLAGWLPPDASSLTRLAAAPIEMVNISRHLAALSGIERVDPIELGSLSVVSHRLSAAPSASAVRELLTRSVWGDPGADDEPSMSFGLHVAWARRAQHAPKIVRPWARAAGVVLLARERFAFERPIAISPARDLDLLLGRRSWRSADSLDELRADLPKSLRWTLDGVGADELWRAEIALLRRVGHEAEHAAASGRTGPDVVAAVLALLLIDLWRVLAGIEAAAGGAIGSEVFDAAAP